MFIRLQVKSIIFGGLDGIVSIFAIVASVVGASLPLEVIILTGFAKLLGDAISMGFGDALSEWAEQKSIKGELKREAWEMEEHPEGEIREMIEIYVKKGFTEDDAKRIIQLMTHKKEYYSYFVEHMMVQELGLKVPDAGDNPAKNGFIAFSSFLFFGGIPLWPYIGFLVADWHNSWGQFGICIGITFCTLFFLGAVQARIIRGSPLKHGVLMTVNGGLTAAASYLIAWGLQEAVHAKSCD